MNLPPVEKNNTSASSVPSTQPIPQTVWILGGMMFLINLSYVMIYSFSGIYLKTLLGIAVTWIGFLEGLAEAASYAMKLFSGMFSDYLRRRKPVMVFGYLLSVFSRPILAISNSFALVLTARLMERLGNGIQASPRDAMVADVEGATPKSDPAGFCCVDWPKREVLAPGVVVDPKRPPGFWPKRLPVPVPV